MASETVVLQDEWTRIVRRQFGAAIDMLERAIRACPDTLWGTDIHGGAYWYIAYHTSFYLDFYLAESDAAYAPPPPFTLDEADERGILPPRVYTKDELLRYIAQGRASLAERLPVMTGVSAGESCGFSWLDLTCAELLLYNMRHIQHHAAQLNLLLRQSGHDAPRWVRHADALRDASE